MIRLILTLSILQACTSRAFHEVTSVRDRLEYFQTPNTETWVYHWVELPNLDENSLVPYLQEKMNESAKNAEISSEEGIPSGATVGYGLYVATDPIQSRSFGTNLIVLPVKPQTEFVPAKKAKLAAVKSSFPVVLYAYTDGWFSSRISGAPAAVIRSPGALDLSKAVAIKFPWGKWGESTHLSAEELATLEKETLARNIPAALKVFERKWQTMSIALAPLFAKKAIGKSHATNFLRSDPTDSDNAAFARLSADASFVNEIRSLDLDYNPLEKTRSLKRALREFLDQMVNGWKPPKKTISFSTAHRIAFELGIANSQQIPPDAESCADDIFTTILAKIGEQSLQFSAETAALEKLGKVMEESSLMGW